MSSVALRITPATTAPELARCVPIDAAAARMQRDEGWLRRLCRDRLAAQGLAVFAAAPGGGQAKWFISRAYDPRLIDGPIGELHREPGLSDFTQKQRQGALARRACVESLRDARRTWPGAAKDWMPRLVAQLEERHGIGVSQTRLYEWDKRYQRPADLVKLIDTRGGNRRGKSDAVAWSAFRDLYLHENQPSARYVWEQVRTIAAESGWTWCSYKSCVGQLNDRIPPEVQTRHREPAKWRQQLRPYIEQDPESWAAGECYIGDDKQLDLVCRFNDSLIRPWLTTWMDWRTRRVVGWVLSDSPNSTTILGALRHGLKDDRNFGGPRAVWMDNGKSWDSWVLHGQTKRQRREKIRAAVDEPRAFGIFAALRIDAHFSIPFNPNGKSRLERWFRTLEDFCRAFDTYTGQDIDSKPERLNEIIAQPHRVPTFERVYERITSHLNGYNACDDHGKRDLCDDESGALLSPDEAMARWCDTRHVMRDPASLDLLMTQWHQPVTVGRNGITLTLRGRALHYGQFNPALTPFKAAKKADRRPVIVAYDPHDLRAVRVHDERFVYVCTAEMNGQGGMHGGDAMSVEHVKTMNRDIAVYAKSLKHVAEHGLTSCLTPEEQLADVAARSRRPAPRRDSSPSKLRIRPTPLDGQAREIERDQLKAAVGAESRSEQPHNRALPSLERLRRNIMPSRTSAAAPEPFTLPKLRERS